jgi:hypothetical protein
MGPKPMSRLPRWNIQAALRLIIRRERWQRMEPLPAASLAEHEQVAKPDEGTVDRCSTVAVRALLLGGGKRPGWSTSALFGRLLQAIPSASAEFLSGLDHFAPDQKAPQFVADPVRRFLES